MQYLLGYLQSNVLMILAYLLLKLISRIEFRSAHKLQLGYLLLGASLLLPALALLFPEGEYTLPSANILAATSMKEIGHSGAVGEGYLVVPSVQPLRLNVFYGWLGWMFWVFLFGGARNLLRIFWDFLVLHKIRSRALCYKRLGMVAVYLSEEIAIPYSYWRPFTANVFLPSALLSTPQQLRVALKHENQHHRQGDTKWNYLMLFIKTFFFCNPFAHLALAEVSKLQEFACDEALVDQRNVSVQAYGGCLLRVAEMALGSHRVLAGTTCMATGAPESLLRQRIKQMLIKNRRYKHGSFTIGMGAMALLAMSLVAFGSPRNIPDRRLGIEEANRLAEVVRGHSKFPITINEEVVRELNRYVGTPDGREFMRQALVRMESHRKMIEERLDHYGLPRELLAVALVESGFVNVGQDHTPYSSGIWQFVPQTAINFGLQVPTEKNPNIPDERYDIPLATDAAARYLGANYFRFKDWELAIMAYNAGENRVQRGIEKTGVKNAWTLIANGFSGDKGYLARVTAGILILNSPSIIS